MTYTVGQFVRLDPSIGDGLERDLTQMKMQEEGDVYVHPARTWAHQQWYEVRPGVWAPRYAFLIERNSDLDQFPYSQRLLNQRQELLNRHVLLFADMGLLSQPEFSADQDNEYARTQARDIASEYGFPSQNRRRNFAALTPRVNINEASASRLSDSDVSTTAITLESDFGKGLRPHHGLSPEFQCMTPVGSLFSGPAWDPRYISIVNASEIGNLRIDLTEEWAYGIEWAGGSKNSLGGRVRSSSPSRHRRNVNLSGTEAKLLYVEPWVQGDPLDIYMDLSSLLDDPDIVRRANQKMRAKFTKEWIGIGKPPVSDIPAEGFYDWIMENRGTASSRTSPTARVPMIFAPTHWEVESSPETVSADDLRRVIEQRDAAVAERDRLDNLVKQIGDRGEQVDDLLTQYQESSQREMEQATARMEHLINQAQAETAQAHAELRSLREAMQPLEDSGWDPGAVAAESAELREAMDEVMEMSDLYQEDNERLSHDNEELRQRLTALIQRFGATDVSIDVEPIRGVTPFPSDVETVVDMVRRAQQQFTHLAFAPNIEDGAGELDGNRTSRTWARKAWAALAALDEYAREVRANPDVAVPMQAFLGSGGAANGLHPSRLALESKYGGIAPSPEYVRSRTFPTPSGWIGDPEVECYPHVKVDPRPPAPRLYFLDDSRGENGVIFVGYLGPHLMNRAPIRA